MITFFNFENTPLILSLDRTNWKWGKKDINILMLSVVYKGIAIPLFWDLLPKRGNSNTLERITLIKRYIEQFGNNKIAFLLADREFVGEKWLEWLQSQRIFPFVSVLNETQKFQTVLEKK